MTLRDRVARDPVGMTVVTLAYTAARLIPMLGTQTLANTQDTADYFASSREGLLSGALWAGRRPAMYAILAKVVARSHTLLFLLQAVVATIAWLALAWLVYTRLRPRVLAAATAIVVLFASLSLDVVQWDRVLLTESLTISLAIALLVLGVLFVEEPSWVRGSALVGTAFAWVFLRDSNGYVVACFAAALLVAAIASRPRRAAFTAVVGALLLVFIAGATSSAIGHRWEGPLKDVITIRALEHSDRTDYLLARGLPLTRSEVSRIAGQCVLPSRPGACVVVTDPRFYEWIRTKGRSAYSRWLLTHPTVAMTDPIRNSGEMLGYRLPVDRFSRYRFAPASLAERIFFVRNQRVLLAESLFAFGLVAFGLAIAPVRRRLSPLGWVVLTALATLYPHLVVVWTFGALETQRHALAASVTLRIGTVLAVACAIEAAIRARTARPGGEADRV